MERRGVKKERKKSELTIRGISRREIKEALKKLKKGKAMELDEIPGEAWKYGEEVEKWVYRFCNAVWKDEGWPEGWKEGIVILIVKRGEGKISQDYRE